jgi:hypothetical protein
MRSLIEDGPRPDEIEVGPNGTSLTLLQAIYRSPSQPLHTRIRAAMACLKHEHPTLGISMVVDNEQDFAALLDQRIARMKAIEQAKLIDGQIVANGGSQSR